MHVHTHTDKNYKFLKKGGQYLTGELLFNKNDESQKTMKVILNCWMEKKTNWQPYFSIKNQGKIKAFSIKTGTF